MTTKLRVSTALMAVAIMAGIASCHGGASSAGGSVAGGSASGGSSGGGAALPVSYASGGTKTVTITDPILNMKAYTLTVPANWMFDGTVIQGSSCATGPFPVFRTSSPDGLMGIKELPRLDWAWSEGSSYAPKQRGDCMNVKKEITAAEVLKYMVGVLKVQYVRDDVNPNREQFQRNVASHNSASYVSHGDQARGWVRYNINSIVIEERLDVSLICSVNTIVMLGRQHSCSAFVGRTWAPQGKWDDNIVAAINKSLVIDQEWNTKWYGQVMAQLNAMQQQGARNVQAIAEAGERQRNALNASFQQAQAVRQQQSQDFISNLQQQGADFRANQQAQQDQRSKVADDWCDIALDRQKRIDPNTGVISKDSNLYSYSWVSDSGARMQTNDINANPNGNGNGTWTLQDNVR